MARHTPAAIERKKGKKNSNKNDALKKQIRSLGGTDEDFNLVKDSGNHAGETKPADAKLTKDVSEFLNGLNIHSNSPPKSQKKKAEGSSKPAKKPKQSNPAPSSSSKPAKKSKNPPKESEPAEEQPVTKTQLPTRVVLNPKSKFTFQPTPQWHEALPPLTATKKDTPAPSANKLASLSSRAAELHNADIAVFQSSSSSGPSTSEAAFLSKIIQSGTLSDRLSALTLLVQSSPVHNTKALETLKNMAERGKGKGGREESLKALRCIVDWWVGGGAPSRKLKYFRDQPLEHPEVTDAHLLLWHFEDWLKKYFFSILQILESLSLDPLPYIRTQSLRLIHTLLSEKPEQEHNLLKLVVNKLGDPENPVASRASYHLLQLLQVHPYMKGVVVREITSLVLKPTIAPTSSTQDVSNRRIKFSDASTSKPQPPKEKAKSQTQAHARYYATITFNQIVLSRSETDIEVATKLMEVYFEMFKELLGEGKDDDDEQVEEGPQLEEEDVDKDKAGRVRDHKSKKGKDKQIKKGGSGVFSEVEESNSKLISAILTGVNRALPFAKLSAGDGKLMKHIDTLFFITHNSSFNISLQALVLIQHICTALSSPSTPTTSASATAKSITDRYYRTLYASLQDTRLASSNKQAMYLNLLFKSIKADVGSKNADGQTNERIVALVRRFLQLLLSGGNGATEFIAGGLYLLGELFSSIPGLRSMIAKTGVNGDEIYDPRKRDPQYAHASSSPLWELTPLLNHYHPTISLHARQLLAGQPLTATADLSLNTLSHFLDRFVYKNPKKKGSDDKNAVSGKAKGPSVMQPSATSIDGTSVKLVKGETIVSSVNEAAFLRRKETDIPVDEVFFHKFFVRKAQKEKKKEKKQNVAGSDLDEDDKDDHSPESDEDDDGGSDEEMDLTGDEAERAKDNEDDEEGSELDEDEVWRAMKASMPKQGDDDDLFPSEGEDSDEVPSDLDDDEDEDDDEAEEVQDADSDDDGLAEGSDNEDLVPLDGDLPSGLVGDDDREEEEWEGISGNKRKRDAKGETNRRKKLRSLPTFASYEDYAKMIEDGPEDFL